MNVLVTAGNTRVLIDKVRCLTNIFTGRTGAALALHAHWLGHAITLLTSHPEAVTEVAPTRGSPGERWTLRHYQTFEELQSLMEAEITAGSFDAVIHCAAVSDYLSAGVYAPAPGTTFDTRSGAWHGAAPKLRDRLTGKVKSDEPEL